MAERQGFVRLRASARWIAAAALIFLPAIVTVAQSGAELPRLRIEAGTHVAKTGDAATDAEGRVLVTGSHDKTARIWSLPDLRLLRVLRPPIGNGDEGKINSVAVSPDGRLVAVGGYSTIWSTANSMDSMDIWLFDIQTGQMVRRFRGAPQVIDSLAFSPDGERLAAGFFAHGIMVWRVADGYQVAQDSAYHDSVYGVAFSLDGHLAAASGDGRSRPRLEANRLEFAFRGTGDRSRSVLVIRSRSRYATAPRWL
jgi:dipeptidyl aminopeptidase/acylaminoacyl peptidase